MKRPPGADGLPRLPLRVRLLRYRWTITTVLVIGLPIVAGFAWHNAKADDCAARGGVLVRGATWGTECVAGVPR